MHLTRKLQCFLTHVPKKNRKLQMKLVYIYHFRPLKSSSFTTSALSFGLAPVYVPFKTLYFHQVLQEQITKQKKLFKKF